MTVEFRSRSRRLKAACASDPINNDFERFAQHEAVRLKLTLEPPFEVAIFHGRESS